MYCENYYKKNCTSNNLSINLMRQKKKKKLWGIILWLLYNKISINRKFASKWYCFSYNLSS